MRSSALSSRLKVLGFALVSSVAIVLGLSAASLLNIDIAQADPTGPAGVTSGLQLWLSADSGAKTTGGALAADGQNILNWEDQSVVARNASGTGAVYDAEGLNFNPTLFFDEDNYTTTDVGLPTGAGGRSIFVVASVNSSGWRYVFGLGNGGPLGSFDFGHRDTGAEEVFITSHNEQEAYNAAWSWAPHGAARLAYGDVRAGFMHLSVNGTTPQIQNNGGASALTTILDGSLNIGCRSIGDECWIGNVSEIIFYDRVVTDTERQRINSYLALKYGFSLDQATPQSYLASGSNLMWDKDASGASTYDNGLFGIGRDDASNLAQVKSLGQTTTNVITIEADEEGSNGNPDWHDIANLEFLVIGDNGGDADWTATGAPDGYSILERQWKKQEQGDVGPVSLSFDTADPDLDIPDALGDGDYYFLYDTDNDGSLADETPVAFGGINGDARLTTVDFGAGGLFTLATTELPALNNMLPSDNNTSVHLTTGLELEFSRAVQAGVGSIRLYRSSNDSLVQTIAANSAAVTGSGSTTINVDINDLTALTGYYVLIDDDAFHNSSNYFAGIANKETWNFTTISSDSDNDGVDSDTENGGPNDGDGNDDGTADADQIEVTSLPNPVAGEDAYLTLAATGDCTELSDVSIKDIDDLDHQDGSFSYPVGLVDFRLICDTPGDSATVTVYFDKQYDTSTWQIRKLIDDTFSQIEDAEISTAEVGDTTVTTLSYELVDGGPLDADGSADGDIVDPVGPAVLAVSTTPTPTPTVSSTPDSSGPLPSTGAMLTSVGLVGGTMALVGFGLNVFDRQRALRPRRRRS